MRVLPGFVIPSIYGYNYKCTEPVGKLATKFFHSVNRNKRSCYSPVQCSRYYSIVSNFNCSRAVVVIRLHPRSSGSPGELVRVMSIDCSIKSVLLSNGHFELIYHTCIACIIGTTMRNRTSPTKPEIHNILQRRQKRVEPRTTTSKMQKKMAKFG